VSVEVRDAGPADAGAVRAVHTAAFPTAGEADLVEALERAGDAVVSLVAEREGEIVGHVLLSRVAASGEGRTYRALGLAPLAVLPEAQRKGIGGALVAAALERAAAAGEELVFLLGDPAFYGRFGFSTTCAAPFASPYAGPHLLALRLRDDVPLPRAGRADYADAFAALDG
jgi:putative acetyltransferase